MTYLSVRIKNDFKNRQFHYTRAISHTRKYFLAFQDRWGRLDQKRRTTARRGGGITTVYNAIQDSAMTGSKHRAPR